MTALHGITARGGSSEWRTPREIFTALGRAGLEGFDVDLAAPTEAPQICHVPARRRIRKAEDALSLDWRGLGRAWLNPPWSDARNCLDLWLGKFVDEVQDGIVLVPDRTSAPWFAHAMRGDLLLFLARKPAFVLPSGEIRKQPPNGAALIAKGEICADALRISTLGWCFTPASVPDASR